MKQKKSISWGIMGCGSIAHKFATDLMTVPNAVLQAVASRNLKKAKEFGSLYNAYSCYGSYQELVHNPKIDVIYIATPHVFHYENTMLCLLNKKAVLCEKPFAMNTSQVKEMIAIAKKEKLFLMEALWTYFLPHYQYVLNIVQNKIMGNIQKINADFGFVGDPNPEQRIYNKKLGGGSLLDVGIYPVFAALSLLGYPEHIEANANFTDTGVDESCTMKLFYKNDINASLSCAIHKKTATEVYIELDQGTITIHGSFHEPSSVTIQKDGVSELIEFPVTSIGYNFEAIHVQQMLTLGKTESTVMSFDKSLDLIQLLDTIREKIDLQYD